MEKLDHYDEAARIFYSNINLKGFPINSLDFHSKHFDKVCGNLNDIRNLDALAEKGKWQGTLPLRSELLQKEHVVVVTDAKLNIVYASQNMRTMNGYNPNEVLGKNPKMFQGEMTCEKTKTQVYEAIQQQKSFEAVLVNYRKDGSMYKCWIQGSPIFDNSGKVVNFIAFEKEVA